MATNFYSALGVPQNATTEQIRSRFLELARQLHPDRFQGAAKEKAEADFQKITEAFNILTHADRRRQHDQELSQSSQPSSGSDPKQIARVYTQRGVKAFRDKKFMEAAENFHRATGEDPSNAKNWYHLAMACNQEERWLDRAVDAARRACELDAMNPAYHKLAGRLFARAGKVEEAERSYQQALRWGGDDDGVRVALEELKKSAKKSRGLFFGRKN